MAEKHWPQLLVLDEWWFWSCEYHYQDGDCELPRDYQAWTKQLVQFTRDVAKQDPTPFWDVGRLIAEHARLGNVVGERFPVTVHQIWDAIDRAVILKDWLWEHGTVDRPRMTPRGKTKDAIKLMQKGRDNDTVIGSTGLAKGNIRQIRHRLETDQYDLSRLE